MRQQVPHRGAPPPARRLAEHTSAQRPAPRAASTSSGRLHSLCCALAPPLTASPTARHLWCRIKAALTLALTLALAPDQALQELLESDDKFGFIVMDGNGSLFGTLAGNTREILHKFSV